MLALVAVAVVVLRSGAKSPGTFAVGWRPRLLRSSDRALEQIADPVLPDLIGGQADRVFDPFSFQALVHAGHGEGCIGPEMDAQDFALIPHDDRLKHLLPAVGAVHIAGT
jgi:hypothetical protein